MSRQGNNIRQAGCGMTVPANLAARHYYAEQIAAERRANDLYWAAPAGSDSAEYEAWVEAERALDAAREQYMALIDETERVPDDEFYGRDA